MANTQNRGRSQAVYEHLRGAIVSGALRPNEPLVEAEISERLNVSRTPVRESLQRLATEELIVPRRRGWAVREYSPQDAQNLAEIRVALEGYAAFLAAERADSAHIERLQAIHETRLTLNPDQEEERVRTNLAFHNAVIEAANNPSLHGAIRASTRFYFNRPIAHETPEMLMRLGNKDHAVILQAIRSRKPKEAEEAMRHHLNRTYKMMERINFGTA